MLSAAVEALFLGTLNINPEGVGGIIGLLYFFFIGPYVFILGYREQRKNEKEKEASRKENLRPLKLDGLKDTLTEINRANSSNQPPRE